MEQKHNLRMSFSRKIFHVEQRFDLKPTVTVHDVINSNAYKIDRNTSLNLNADNLIAAKYKRCKKHHDFLRFVKELKTLALNGSSHQQQAKAARLLNKLQARKIIPSWKPVEYKPFFTSQFKGEI